MDQQEQWLTNSSFKFFFFEKQTLMNLMFLLARYHRHFTEWTKSITAKKVLGRGGGFVIQGRKRGEVKMVNKTCSKEIRKQTATKNKTKTNLI